MRPYIENQCFISYIPLNSYIRSNFVTVMRKGKVYVHGIYAGLLCENDSPREYTFQYSPDYLRDMTNPPVSLLMPLREETYRSDVLFPYFFNMLSEGENRTLQAAVLRIDRDDDFGILLATAGHDTIGAVTVRPA